jgi:isopentenyl-diphosphate Delta-isomerase
MTYRETHLVELVDSSGVAIGQSTVETAHQAPGQLHRAFSVVLTDPAGRILLQQRAEVKTRFPLRWANACCGHPTPGQSPVAAASLRLPEELGIEAVPLTEVGVYQYFAEDPATGRVEREYDHVLLGALESGHGLRPDPAEVADLRWIQADELVRDLRLRPEAYAPWLGGVIGRVMSPSAAGSASSATERSGER